MLSLPFVNNIQPAACEPGLRAKPAFEIIFIFFCTPKGGIAPSSGSGIIRP